MPFVTIWEKRRVFISSGVAPGLPEPPIVIPPDVPGYPDQGLPGVPPGIWPGPGYPDQGLPGVPPGIWPGPGYPDQGLPGRPPTVWPRPPVYPGQGLPVPPAVWPRPPVYPDQGLPGVPPGIWPGPGYPDQGLPGRPPTVWPRPPSGPPIYQELPEDFEPPSSPPAAPPDMASPGHWAAIIIDGAYKNGFVQTAIETDPDHVAKPPKKGLPGEWIAVYAVDTSAGTYAWIPTESGGTPSKPSPK